MSTLLDSNRSLGVAASVLITVILAIAIGWFVIQPTPFEAASAKCAEQGGIATGVNEGNDSFEDVYATSYDARHRWYVVTDTSRTEVTAHNGDFFCEAPGQPESFHVILFPIPVS